MSDPSPELALRDIAPRLRAIGVPFALVGGLAVAIRGEVRFTKNVDLVVLAEGSGMLARHAETRATHPTLAMSR